MTKRDLLIGAAALSLMVGSGAIAQTYSSGPAVQPQIGYSTNSTTVTAPPGVAAPAPAGQAYSTTTVTEMSPPATSQAMPGTQTYGGNADYPNNTTGAGVYKNGQYNAKSPTEGSSVTGSNVNSGPATSGSSDYPGFNGGGEGSGTAALPVVDRTKPPIHGASVLPPIVAAGPSYPEGSVMYPDGTVVYPDGRMVRAEALMPPAASGPVAMTQERTTTINGPAVPDYDTRHQAGVYWNGSWHPCTPNSGASVTGSNSNSGAQPNCGSSNYPGFNGPNPAGSEETTTTTTSYPLSGSSTSTIYGASGSPSNLGGSGETTINADGSRTMTTVVPGPGGTSTEYHTTVTPPRPIR